MPIGDDAVDGLLSADLIRKLLTELSAELGELGFLGELYLVGGAAMALGYGAREATRDAVEAAYGAGRIPAKTALLVESILSADDGPTRPTAD